MHATQGQNPKSPILRTSLVHLPVLFLVEVDLQGASWDLWISLLIQFGIPPGEQRWGYNLVWHGGPPCGTEGSQGHQGIVSAEKSLTYKPLPPSSLVGEVACHDLQSPGAPAPYIAFW